MISVIIPVYNGEKYLNECLDSIVGVNTEIIVINDGSTDNTKKIASEYTKSVINTDRIGPVRARNIGINKSNNEYLMFMDADDICWNICIISGIVLLFNNSLNTRFANSGNT